MSNCKIIKFIKREKVFCIAAAAAFVSAFFVRPDAMYASYIDTRVLLVLFSLMLVVAGLRSCGMFDKCADFLCSHVKTQRSLSFVLVFLCFVFSMFITNDVALLTFVPFAVLLLSKSGGIKHLPFVVVLQTIAANLGSMLMPTGNPQNIFLYSKMDTGFWGFIKIVLPYSCVSLVLLAVCLLFIPSSPLSNESFSHRPPKEAWSTGLSRARIYTIVYAVLFLLCLLCVLKIIPALITAVICAAVVFFIQRNLLMKVDYVLLLTFCAFFVFTGNIERITTIRSFLEKTVAGHEFISGVCASQVISNVPSALLLYPFSSISRTLLLGVNVGGLGTLVASLASLISYKLYVNRQQTLPAGGVTSAEKAEPQKDQSGGGSYLLLFTVMNILFLAVLCLAYFIFH